MILPICPDSNTNPFLFCTLPWMTIVKNAISQLSVSAFLFFSYFFAAKWLFRLERYSRIHVCMYVYIYVLFAIFVGEHLRTSHQLRTKLHTYVHIYISWKRPKYKVKSSSYSQRFIATGVLVNFVLGGKGKRSWFRNKKTRRSFEDMCSLKTTWMLHEGVVMVVRENTRLQHRFSLWGATSFIHTGKIFHACHQSARALQRIMHGSLKSSGAIKYWKTLFFPFCFLLFTLCIDDSIFDFGHVSFYHWAREIER